MVHSRPIGREGGPHGPRRALYPFALTVNSRGNGSGGVVDDLILILSEGASYRIWVVPTVPARSSDLLTIPGASGVLVLRANCVNVESAGRPRGYRKYDEFRIQGGEVVGASLEGFPMWIRWRGRENHAPEPRDPAREPGSSSAMLDPVVLEK